MSRATVGAIVLAAIAALLAVGLFVAGAMWRARVTGVAGPRVTPALSLLENLTPEIFTKRVKFSTPARRAGNQTLP